MTEFLVLFSKHPVLNVLAVYLVKVYASPKMCQIKVVLQLNWSVCDTFTIYIYVYIYIYICIYIYIYIYIYILESCSVYQPSTIYIYIYIYICI